MVRPSTRSFGIFLVLLAVWEFIAWAGAKFLTFKQDLPHADVLVVLSGSGTYHERAQWAAQLFKEGRSQQLVLTNDGNRSGWSQAEQRNPFFVERSAQELETAGVPRQRIQILPQIVDGTYAEATVLRDYALATGARSLLVVTSRYHSRRAFWTLQRVFNDSGITIGLSVAPLGGNSPGAATWWLSVRGWRMVAGEYLKFIYYWSHYR